MPVTLLSHQALVLPLKMRWPRWFSGLALCVGSMVPDLEFIGRLRDDWIISHTISAQLWFTIPVSLGLVWILTSTVVPALLPFVRDHPAWRLHDLAALTPPRSRGEWCRAALSAWIGGMSHVLLDAVTHGNHSGWLVPWLPVLQRPVPHFGGPVPLHDALQVWLTVVFGLASLHMWRAIARRRLLWRWRALDVRALPRMTRVAGHRLLLLCVLAALQGAVIGSMLRGDGDRKARAAGVLFGAIDGVCCVAVLTAYVVRHRRVTLMVGTS